MSRFDSAGSGLARGLVQGMALREMRKDRKARRDAEAKAALKQEHEDFVAKMKAAEESAIQNFEGDLEMMAKAIQQGAALDDPNLQPIRNDAIAGLQQYAKVADALISTAASKGYPPEVVDEFRQKYGDPERFVADRIALMDSQLNLTQKFAETAASRKGEAAGEEQFAKTQSLAEKLGVPVARVAEAQGLLPEDTTVADNLALEQRLNDQTQQRLKTEDGFRTELNRLSNDYFETSKAMGRIQAAATNPSPAGDIALMFSFMKLQDPESTVAPGELATADSAGSASEQVWGLYNRVVSGERLTESQRNDFLGRAFNITKAAERHAIRTRDVYARLAEDAGVKVENVVGPFDATRIQSTSGAADFIFNPETGKLEPANDNR